MGITFRGFAGGLVRTATDYICPRAFSNMYANAFVRIHPSIWGVDLSLQNNLPEVDAYHFCVPGLALPRRQTFAWDNFIGLKSLKHLVFEEGEGGEDATFVGGGGQGKRQLPTPARVLSPNPYFAPWTRVKGERNKQMCW